MFQVQHIDIKPRLSAHLYTIINTAHETCEAAGKRTASSSVSRMDATFVAVLGQGKVPIATQTLTHAEVWAWGACRIALLDAAGAHGLVQRERDGRRAGVAVAGQVADHALGRHAQPLRRAVQDALRAVPLQVSGAPQP